MIRTSNSRMTSLNLKPTHELIQNFCSALAQFENLGVSHESAVNPPSTACSTITGEGGWMRGEGRTGKEQIGSPRFFLFASMNVETKSTNLR